MSNTAPRTRRPPEEQARLEVRLREVFEECFPFNRLMGIKVETLDPRQPKISFGMRQELVGSYMHSRLHGGAIATALDTVGGLAVTLAVAEKHADETVEQLAQRFTRCGTIDLRVDYLNPGVGKRFSATATVMRLGGKIASVRMELHNDAGVLVAIGSAAYAVS
ncbi:thioesterase family protein [Geotalea toluenoxydans]|uniref:thioesterase family protein n=1 Tax=Geotalea toluenoxydans TaxID=421624 RepID=UPI0006D01903|nr:thioesterase family protein [Geotalea toluenoxydans]